nr:lysine-rich arabinogalactan protein 19 [Oryza sativa Japonica Group]
MAISGSAPRRPSHALLPPSAAGGDGFVAPKRRQIHSPAGSSSVLPSTAITSPPPSSPLPSPMSVGREEAPDLLLAVSCPAPLLPRAAIAPFPELPPSPYRRCHPAASHVIKEVDPASLVVAVARSGLPRRRSGPRRRGGGHAPPPLPRPSPLADAVVEATTAGGGLSGCTALRELYLAWNKISDEGLHWLLKPTWRVPTL